MERTANIETCHCLAPGSFIAASLPDRIERRMHSVERFHRRAKSAGEINGVSLI
jgi:hypothetical protein